MKTIIVTTKNKDKNFYQIIRDNWFKDCSFLRIHIDSSIVSPELQSEYNTVCVKEQDEFKVCLLECINPDMPQDMKVNYIIFVICALIQKLSISNRNHVYLLIHAGDLFSLQDARRITGRVPLDWFDSSLDNISKLKNLVEEKHIYQYRHDSNDVSDLLLYSDDDMNLSALCKSLITIIEGENL